MPWDHRRFWLVDLIALVLIGGCTVALLLPAVPASREAARRNQCISHLKQVGLALQNHHDVHKRFPAVSHQGNPAGAASVWWPDPGAGAGSGAVPSVGYTSDAGTPSATAGYSWIVMILPYMDEQPLYDAIAEASDGFKADAFTPFDVAVTEGGPTFSSVIHARDAEPIRKHFAAIQLDQVTCPSYVGNAPVAPWNDWRGNEGSPDTVPAAYGYPAGSDRLGSPAALACVTNYAALSATHFTLMQYARATNLAATTEIPPGAEPPNGLIVPGIGLNIKSLVDGTSRTLIVCETMESAVNCWYDGTTTWTTGLDPNTVVEFPPEKIGGVWIAPAGCKAALNVGPAPDPTRFYCPSLPGYCATPRLIAWGPSSNHAGGVVLHSAADGSVHNVTPDIDPTLYARLITIAGGENVVPPDMQQ